MTRPLVSIMLPCFNSAASLPYALASVAAQTIDDWECICIDDGSRDATWNVLTQAARDPRFRIHRFSANRGRGAARQAALDLSTGKYLAFLDSDDWMFPERLATEARWLDEDAKLVVVAVCAAVTFGPEELVGVMPRSKPTQAAVISFEEPVPPPLLFPPSMIRTDIAQRTRFDPAFLRAQDSDFLIRAMLGGYFAMLPEVLYAYSQASSASLARTMQNYPFRMRAHMRHFRRFPLRVTRTVAETVAKMATYRMAGLFGYDKQLIERRWGPVDAVTRDQFASALAVVREHMGAFTS